MSLRWDVSRCKDSDALIAENEWAITNALILITVPIGIGNWTEKEAAEIYARVHLLELTHGELVIAMKDGERVSRPITPEDIHKRIGMTTNVARISTAAFVRNVITKGLLRDALWDYNQWRRKQEDTPNG